MKEKMDTWTITVELTVFAGDMDKDNVISNAEELLPNLLDGTDFTGINVVDAQRDGEDSDTINISWNITDVKGMQGYEDMTDDECRQVLELAKRNHDATIGVNWDTLAFWADEVKEARVK